MRCVYLLPEKETYIQIYIAAMAREECDHSQLECSKRQAVIGSSHRL